MPGCINLLHDHRLCRRQALAGLAALGAGALLPSGALLAQPPGGAARRLDFHHHFASPSQREFLSGGKRPAWNDMPNVLSQYDPERGIEEMDRNDVATAFMSCSSPGVFTGDDFLVSRTQAILRAREMNDYGAKLVSDYKGRYGLFAVLPLPDVDASLREIEYALDVLKADGVGLLTSYVNHWLGDKLFEPVFEELNRRHAVVFVHPTDTTCCHSIGGANPSLIEWLTDTARCIMSIVFSDVRVTPIPPLKDNDPLRPSPATRYPNIKFVWSHAGGSLIGVATRLVGDISDAALALPVEENSRLYHLRRFYYDTAGSANALMLQALSKLVGTTQIVFGTDYPYQPINGAVSGLSTCGFSAHELRGINRENAIRFLPKYA